MCSLWGCTCFVHSSDVHAEWSSGPIITTSSHSFWSRILRRVHVCVCVCGRVCEREEFSLLRLVIIEWGEVYRVSKSSLTNRRCMYTKVKGYSLTLLQTQIAATNIQKLILVTTNQVTQTTSRPWPNLLFLLPILLFFFAQIYYLFCFFIVPILLLITLILLLMMKSCCINLLHLYLVPS